MSTSIFYKLFIAMPYVNYHIMLDRNYSFYLVTHYHFPLKSKSDWQIVWSWAYCKIKNTFSKFHYKSYLLSRQNVRHDMHWNGDQMAICELLKYLFYFRR